MLNIGIGEMTLILIAALLIMGPDRLPEFARSLGKFMREFRRQTDDVRGVVMREIYKIEDEVDLDGTRAKAKTLPPPSPVNQVIPPAAVAETSRGPSTGSGETAPTGQVNPHQADTPQGGAAQVREAQAGTEQVEPAQVGSGQVGTLEQAPPEPNVTIVDGIRIAPATGAVARNARPAPAPAPTTAAPAASDAPPPPTPTSQS
jgi:sec-independent protein translocase protein TatB